MKRTGKSWRDFWKQKVLSSALLGLLVASSVGCASQNVSISNQASVIPETEEIESSVISEVEMSTEDNLEVVQQESSVEITEDHAPKSDKVDSTLDIHFIDVGQGDATLLICDDHALLLDTGDTTQGTAVRNYLKKQGVDSLDYLVLTHPDSDHIGGAASVITNVNIDTVLMTEYEKDNKTYDQLMQSLSYKSMTATIPEAGSEYTLGSASFTVLGPLKKYSDPNDASLVLMFTHGDNKFLFTGDAEEAAEADMCATYGDLSADVYQAGHHGSKTASSEAFMKKVNPEYCVISCGEGNSYGHPHAQTLNTLRSMGVSVYRTDEQGSLIVSSDGEKLTWNASPSETWQAGEGTANSQDVDNTKQEAAATDAGSAATVTNDATTPTQTVENSTATDSTEISFVLNTKTHKFHRTSCGSLPTTNRKDTTMTRDEVIAAGYEPCKKCNP